MTQGKHGTFGARIAAGLLSAAAGLALLIAAIAVHAKSDPALNPEGRQVSVLLGLGALVLIGIPAFAVIRLAARGTVRGVRAHNAWVRSLPPEERAAVYLAEAAVLEAAHLEMKRQHRETQDRLSTSATGEPHGDPWGN